MTNEKIAVVRIRGIRSMKPKIKKTLELLNLNKPNHCILINNTKEMLGMINMVKNYVAYGNVSAECISKLLKKRGEKGGKRVKELFNESEINKMAKEVYQGEPVKKYVDSVFRLKPPSKGYKNIKKGYPLGDIGKRDDMDRLLSKMM